MAVYQFSALADGQAISNFSASSDRLNFDQTSIAAGDIRLIQENSTLHVLVKSGPQDGKDVFVLNFEQVEVSTSNFTFADGSVALVGDNSPAFNTDQGSNTLIGGAGRDLLMGLGGNDSLNGGSGNDWLEGNPGNDTLTGSGGQDTFVFANSGAADADFLADFASNWDRIELDANSVAFAEIGATGRFAANDVRFFAGTAAHDADDRIIYNAATGQIFYDADGNGAGAAQLIATLPAGRGVVAADFNVFGTPPPAGNTINGTSGNDTLTGTSGPDTINGLGGDDSLDGAFGSDSLNGGAGNDYLFGGSDVDRSGEGADTLVGGDGNDTLDGWSISNRTSPDPNVETLDGGLGNDVFNVDNEADVLRDAGGTDLVQVRTGDWTLAAGFENLILFDQEDGTNEGIGNELDNVMESRAWEAELQGMGGNDLLTVYDSGGRTQILRGGDGNDTLLGSSGTTRTTLDGGAGNDSMVGESATMTGGDGDDTLVGGSGLDFNDMTGGAGSDRFVFTSADNFTFLRDFASGSDRLVLDGSGFDGIGASGDLSASDERFFAAAGATAAHNATDRIILNTSTGDLYYDADGNGSATAQRIAAVTGTLAATDISVINGTASGGQTINGTPGNDSLAGGPDSDTINGFAGDDTIDGAGGRDSMIGGAGNDLYFVDDSSDITIELENEGIDEVRSSADSYRIWDWVNNLTLTGSAQHGFGNAIDNAIVGNNMANDLIGEGGNDTLRGGAGDDFLDGGSGSDSLDGGVGNDTYVVTAGDVLSDSGGNDTVIASMSWSLASAFENLTLTGSSNLDGSGNFFANAITGNSGNNILKGRDGHDTLTGAGGNDFFDFVTAPSAANSDVIADFTSGADRLRLDDGVHAGIGATGNFAAGDGRFFAGAGATSGHDANDRVVYDTSTGALYYDADGSGAGAAVLVATLQDHPALAATDISVI